MNSGSFPAWIWQVVMFIVIIVVLVWAAKQFGIL
jgi:hypothetical protein